MFFFRGLAEIVTNNNHEGKGTLGEKYLVKRYSYHFGKTAITNGTLSRAREKPGMYLHQLELAQQNHHFDVLIMDDTSSIFPEHKNTADFKQL